jgi:hypothetical protein
MEELLKESKAHGWPSFRNEEVVWAVRVRVRARARARVRVRVRVRVRARLRVGSTT